uniref:hypothetical protein n=1 Tax=Pseudomonas veronii TaxID=76761 RepID=UPI003C7C3B45
MNFTDELVAAFPASNPVPSVLRQTMEFLEALGCVRHYRTGGRYMTLHPEPEYNNSAITAFHVPDSADTARWTACEDPRVNERLSIFLRTGGDGSWAGLWLDDHDQQRIVHLGSGSGSDMLCVLTNSTQDLIRLLAIGYNEHCWPEEFTRTPAELREQQYADDDYPAPPRALRAYVERTLGLSVPARASDLISSTTSMDAHESSDPFWNWLKQVRND